MTTPRQCRRPHLHVAGNGLTQLVLHPFSHPHIFKCLRHTSFQAGVLSNRLERPAPALKPMVRRPRSVPRECTSARLVPFRSTVWPGSSPPFSNSVLGSLHRIHLSFLPGTSPLRHSPWPARTSPSGPATSPWACEGAQWIEEPRGASCCFKRVAGCPMKASPR